MIVICSNVTLHSIDCSPMHPAKWDLDRAFSCAEQGDYIRAATYFQAADLLLGGNADCEYNVGALYEETGENRLAMQEWYSKSSARGCADADYQLGWYYYEETSYQDYDKAAYHFRRAAEVGHVEAQLNLGYCYAMGRGVKQDDGRAFRWIKQAIDSGKAETTLESEMRTLNLLSAIAKYNDE